MIINFSITPLVGANDLFWTNRMGNPLAVAGQAAANQVFNSAFWLASFLPSVTSTLVSKEHAQGNNEGVQDAVCQALFVGVLMAAVGTMLFHLYPEKTLGTVVETGAPAMEFARVYMSIRAFSFLPAIISLVGFSAFRGTCQHVRFIRIDTQNDYRYSQSFRSQFRYSRCQDTLQDQCSLQPYKLFVGSSFDIYILHGYQR